ncbi:MAG: TIGR02646 family protein [Gallionellaceae bacterium]|nr:MAG: TIGR02646 family protein [Gallionellaceae bacterium]
MYGYCENRIDAQTSHIEHLHPQSRYPQKQLDYSNLLASCEAGGKKAHCGHKKDRRLLPITPLDPIEPSQHFIFAADGHIYPRPENNNAADTTIKVLGLDAKRLVTMRSTAISTIIALLINSPEERQQTLDAVSPSSDKLYEFYSAIRYQIDQLTTLPAQ